MAPDPPADPDLARGIGFDAGDLLANRRGQLSPGQLERLRGEQAKMSSQSTVAGIVMLGFLGVVAAIALPGAAQEGGTRAALLVGMVLAMIAVVLAAGIFLARRLKGGRPDLTVHTVEGLVRCREDSDSACIHVADVTFWVAPLVLAAFADGRRYRIHYVYFQGGRWYRPISAEPA